LQKLHDDAAPIVAGMKPLGRLDGAKRLQLAISLPLRNTDQLANFLRDAYSPASASYHKFLTPAQFAERFGPSKEDYQALITYARAHGFKVIGTHPNRTILDVEGAVSDIEKTFNVKMQAYQHPMEGRQFYAPDTDPTSDAPVTLMRISGLDNYALPRPNLKIRGLAEKASAKGNAGSGPGGTYAGYDFRTAYAPQTALEGYGQTVGLLEFDGYTADDITYYENKEGLPNVPLTNVLLDGATGAPSGSGGEVEVSLDIEMAISMAPGLNQVLVYDAGESGNWHDILNRMATDDLAMEMSCSWYIPSGPADPVADQIFQQMAAQGQSFFSASGDSDAYTGLIPFPGDTPYITEVGGTTLTTSGPAGAWIAETVWNWGDGVGGSGGISTQYAIPFWQAGINMSLNQGSTIMRNTPDVAMTADNVYVRVDGEDDDVGGTSCAAPLWAAFTALINQQATTRGEPVGFLNPALYALASGSNYDSQFNDIVTGNNFSPSSPTQFSAEPGYDLCTGLGTPAGSPLIAALAGPPDPLKVTYSYLSAIGPAGGPFLPNTTTYTLSDTGTESVNWSVNATQSWVTLSSTAGVLNPGDSAEVIASINDGAKSLSAGSYISPVTFTDNTTGAIQPRSINLDIRVQYPALSVTPNTGFTIGGPPGGSFNPSSVTYIVSNVGETPVSWAVSNTAAWLTFSPAGGTLAAGGSASVTATLTPAASLLPTGDYAASVEFANLNNGTGDLSIPATLLVWPPPPVITSATTARANESQAFSYQISATNTPTGYRAFGLPEGLILAAQTGLISGSSSQSGTFDTTIEAVNLGGTGTATLAITVAPELPVITSTLTVTGTYEAAFNYQITATDQPTSFTSSGLPRGLSLNSSTGLISGTPTAIGATAVTITAFNSVGPANAGLQITIAPMPPPLVTNPVITFHGFGLTDGAYPDGALIEGTDGNLYGTTEEGGASEFYGAVFKLTLSGSFTTLTSFNGTDGYFPEAGVVMGSDGNLYGTTYEGGADFEGSIFQVSTSGSSNNFFSFDYTDGGYPMAALIQAKDHNLYGVDSEGGADGDGVIFKSTLSGSVTTITTFTSTNGEWPEAALTQGTDNFLYGTTYYGGSNGDGTVFKVSTAGALGTLFSFNGTNGLSPEGALVQGTDGYFYGTTYSGGSKGDGTIFKISSGGAFTSLVSFSGTNGENPEGNLIQGGDGNFYGTTYNGGPYGLGIVFRVTSSGSLTTVCAFDGANGEYPAGGVMQATDGYYYGTTYQGGPSGYGTVFKVGVFVASGVVGQPFSYQITASSNPTSYSTSSNLPPGLQLNASTGVISGTPTATGTTSVAFTATNAGGSNTVTVTISIVMPPIPVFTSPLEVTVQQGQLFTYLLQASADPMSYQAGALPPGLAFNSATAVISGVPTVAGTTSVPVGATNPAGTGTADLIIIVAPTAPVITTAFKSIYSFAAGAGANPAAGVIQGSDGNFYGTTQSAGSNSDGSVLQVTPSGSGTTIASLAFAATGGYPQGQLLEANDGSLYGTAQSGGSDGEGTVYQLSLSGSIGTVWPFNYSNGAEPMGGLIQGTDENLYGTTEVGGTNGEGTVFRVALGGTVSMICSFDGTDGAEPACGLAQGSDGNLYGTTLYGGGSNLGTVFQVTTSGSLVMLCAFDGTNGSEPIAGLAEGSNGNYYGTTLYGGTFNAGTVFDVTSSGSLTTLCSFNNADGANPFGTLIEGGDGNFYGTTSSGGNNNLGTIFEVTPGGELATLYSFTGSSDGATPEAGLVQGADGYLYGTTVAGGANGNGTVFGIMPLYLTGTMNQPLSYQITATNYPTSYNAIGLPPGLSVDTVAGLISGTATASGTSVVTISASNAGGSGTATLLIVVLPLPPAISGSLAVTGTFDMPFQYQIEASNGPTSYGAAGLPSWLALNPATGVLSGTATATGTSNVTISAMSAGGTNSATLSITIVPPAPYVATGSASGVTYNEASVSGTVNPNGLDASYYFEFGTTTTYGSTTTPLDAGSGTANVPVAVFVPNLLAFTTYHYRLDASNSSGITYGADQTLTTLVSPPAAVTGSAYSITYDSAIVSGVVGPQDGFATTAYFSYGTTSALGNTTPSQSVGSGTGLMLVSTTGTLAGLEPNTLYYYTIVAVNSSGTTQGVPVESFSTPPPPPTATTGAAMNVTYDGAALSGSVNPDGLDTTYWFQYGAGTNYGGTTASQDAGSGTNGIAVLSPVSGLAAMGSYHYRIVAVNSSGTAAGEDEVFSTQNGQPVAVNDEAYTASGQSVKINVLANDYDPDGDTLAIVSTTQGTYGAVVMNADSTLTYVPGPKFKTQDQFTYRITDGHGATATATVFVHNGFISGEGSYNGLVSGTVPLNETSGFLGATINPSGQYGAEFMYAGLMYRWFGRLDVNLQSAILLPRTDQAPIAVTLQLDPGNSQIEGLVTTGSDISELIAPVSSYGVGNPAPERGRYIAVLTPGIVLSGTSYPQKNGSLTINVSAGGVVTAVGRLGDGAGVSASGLMVSGSSCPFYARLYGGTYPYAGSIFGNLNFETAAGAGECSGTFYWFKPAQKSGAYPAGFSMTVPVQGSR